MRRLLPYALLFLMLLAWTYTLQDTPFFWDTVQLGSKHAHYFFENGLDWTALPNEIDSGHPPAFGFYLALMWTVFRKSLIVSHWAMFPFLLSLVWLVYRLGEQLGGREWAFWLLPVVLLDPVVAGQSALVGPDIVLVVFFMLAVWSLLLQRKPWALLAILGLCIISMRGMMTAAALLLWQILSSWQEQRRFPNLLQQVLVFVPGFVAAACFLWWHYGQTGWIGFHPNSPWAPAFEPVDARQFLKNILAVGWRWLDFGRFFEWAILIYLALQIRFKHAVPTQTKAVLIKLTILLFCLLLFLSPSAFLYHNLSAHRYFLPLFLSFHLLVFYWLINGSASSRLKKGLLILLVIGLGTGNLWIYPRGISMDWDATLAHLPYHQLRTEMLAYIDENNIAYEQIGTAFPNINSGEHLLLNGDQRMFAEKDFTKNRYILSSNVFNDFSEEDYQILEQNWQLLKRLEQGRVWMSLYKKTKIR